MERKWSFPFLHRVPRVKVGKVRVEEQEVKRLCQQLCLSPGESGDRIWVWTRPGKEVPVFGE